MESVQAVLFESVLRAARMREFFEFIAEYIELSGIGSVHRHFFKQLIAQCVMNLFGRRGYASGCEK